jgi:hypothetical protein
MCTYIQLDTSFRAVKKYVYSIPLGIHANESFPLAIMIGLSESVELYQMFYDAMAKVGVSQRDLFSKPILSDQHSSLMAMGRGRPHFWCLRHLIEKFGANSIQGQFTRRLAFCSTPNQFASEVGVCGKEIKLLLTNERITLEELNTLFELFWTCIFGRNVYVQI